MAAAIAVGLASCSLNQAMAACPCEQTKVPECNSCKKVVDDCGCKKVQNDCDCKEKIKDCDCAEGISSLDPSGICPQPEKIERADYKQVYSFPNAIYGTNNYVGEDANGILSTENALNITPNANAMAKIGGFTVATNDQITGAAAGLPCISDEFGIYNGVPLKNQDLMGNSSSSNCGCNSNMPIDIQTKNTMKVVKKSFQEFTCHDNTQGSMTGAAADMNRGCQFPDVTNDFWASCDIDKLAMNDVVVGYPNGYFLPNRNISRAELATMLVKGFDMDCNNSTSCMFSDVPQSHWANSNITTAVEENLLAGETNSQFMPNKTVSRLDALKAIAKGIDCPMTDCEADEILSNYTDGHLISACDKISVAKALKNDALKLKND